MDNIHVFELVTALAESAILVPLPSVGRASVAHTGLFSILRSSRFEFMEAYLAY